ncbi:alkaline phosphatase family protein [uncultured Rhodoblastus sp.]|uniref:alkaline phosphatase family protein n=1 Tax=uncultured Rhodoblastus sp. TaxID=543037 RepID=UPI0025FFB6F5|nr:alkaline phosphatase family protein [uncultured Rhodoblastus sp.]
MRLFLRLLPMFVAAHSFFAVCAAAQSRPYNVLLFVADGLRPGMVNAQNAPAMTALMRKGVVFANSHAVFPTFTTPNAASMATGHYPGDHGDFSNTMFIGKPIDVPGQGETLTPFLESDPVLADVDAHFAGDYLDEETILHAARNKGFGTASIGKLGPSLIMDHLANTRDRTVPPDSLVVDDSTGGPSGVPLAEAVKAKFAEAGLAATAPDRGDNKNPGTLVANVEQQQWFVSVATKVALPLFKERGKPFVLVYWSRDPDGTQHIQGDSLLRLVPGINGPTSLASIRNADNNLAALLDALKAQGLDGDTDVILTSDHGFSTITKESATSWAAAQSYGKVPAHLLPPGFVALDLAHGLDLPLFDPDAKNAPVAAGETPKRANGLIGPDPARPDVVVAANGGSDFVYLPKGDKALARKIVGLLSAQDYVSGLFVDDDFGEIPGTLPLSAISLKGSAVTPFPAIAVNFRSFALGCDDPTACGVAVADTNLQQGQGMHGSFSRADTPNVMAALGPSFRENFVDPAPASNADIGKTIARLLDLDITDKGKLIGRVLAEAMPNGALPEWRSGALRSAPDALGHVTRVEFQSVGTTLYFDAAGYPGRTLGLPAEKQ